MGRCARSIRRVDRSCLSPSCSVGVVCERAPAGRRLNSLRMRYYLTTPIYYVNSTPHIGHAYTTIAADILVRHHRQRGDDSFFLTGVDEHATKVYRVAQEQGLDPQEYVDRIAEFWRELPGTVGAEPDFFIRTSDEGHKEFVREFVQRIYDNGDVYEDVYAGLYCVGCEAVQVGGPARRRQVPAAWRSRRVHRGEELLLPAVRLPGAAAGPLRRAAGLRAAGFRYNEARSFIAGGLQDFSISRAGQPWGIPLPWDESQVAYVWADALVNYLSALSLRPPGRGPRTRVLACRAPHARQGHPSLPLRVLARDAHVGGIRRAAAALRARLPDDGRSEDLEISRERHRPAPAGRCIRDRSGALLGDPLGDVRTRRCGIRGLRSTNATSGSWRTSSGTSCRERRR